MRPNLGGHEGNDQETQPGIGVSRVMCSAIVANMKRQCGENLFIVANMKRQGENLFMW